MVGHGFRKLPWLIMTINLHNWVKHVNGRLLSGSANHWIIPLEMWDMKTFTRAPWSILLLLLLQLPLHSSPVRSLVGSAAGRPTPRRLFFKIMVTSLTGGGIEGAEREREREREHEGGKAVAGWHRKSNILSEQSGWMGERGICKSALLVLHPLVLVCPSYMNTVHDKIAKWSQSLFKTVWRIPFLMMSNMNLTLASFSLRKSFRNAVLYYWTAIWERRKICRYQKSRSWNSSKDMYGFHHDV